MERELGCELMWQPKHEVSGRSAIHVDNPGIFIDQFFAADFCLTAGSAAGRKPSPG